MIKQSKAISDKPEKYTVIDMLKQQVRRKPLKPATTFVG